MIDVDKAITTAVKTGKVVLGEKEATMSVKSGKAQMVMIASNIPNNLRDNLENYGKLSGIPIVTYEGSSLDLGRICGKRFPVGTLTVKEPGDSTILKLAEEASKNDNSSNEEEETD
jgi:large subunit ribosomal protein L30e